jgi:hypothetical protein
VVADAREASPGGPKCASCASLDLEFWIKPGPE